MMRMWLLWCVLVVIGATSYLYYSATTESVGQDVSQSYSQTEPGFEPEPETAELVDIPIGAPGRYTIAELQNWERAPGPLRVGLQVGHWQNSDMPTELENLERNTGAVWNGQTEAEVMLLIVRQVADLLEAEGIVVDILPATVPPGYEADVFAAIHADGNTNTSVNGFKFAAPRRDYAGTSAALVEKLYETYGAATGLAIDPSISRRMTAYYAFNWPRYEHAIHPLTPAVIIETGFLTSPVDREVIVSAPERAAAGIANGIMSFLTDETVIKQPLPQSFTTLTVPVTGDVGCAPVRAERLERGFDAACQPALTVPDKGVFLLVNYSSTTISFTEPYTSTGTYIPIQNLPQYFWFPYEVAGVLVDPEKPLVDEWFLRS